MLRYCKMIVKVIQLYHLGDSIKDEGTLVAQVLPEGIRARKRTMIDEAKPRRQ